MIENKLYVKLLSLNGLAAKLSSLNGLAGWAYIHPDKSGMLSGYSLSSLFDTGAEKDTEEKNKQDADHLNGLKGMILSFQGCIRNLSERLSGFSQKQDTHLRSEKMTERFVLEKYDHSLPGNKKEFLKIPVNFFGLQRDSYSQKQLTGNPGIGIKMLRFHTDNKNIETSSMINSNMLLSEKNNHSREDNKGFHLREVRSIFQRGTVSRERLLDGDILRKVSSSEKSSQEKASCTVHQTFGDIVLQPGSMDVSMQQLKIKIQDILKEARDSIY